LETRLSYDAKPAVCFLSQDNQARR
jgi:hypothetical protein